MLLINKLKEGLKMLANKINTATLHPIKKHLLNFLFTLNALQL